MRVADRTPPYFDVGLKGSGTISPRLRWEGNEGARRACSDTRPAQGARRDLSRGRTTPSAIPRTRRSVRSALTRSRLMRTDQQGAKNRVSKYHTRPLVEVPQLDRGTAAFRLGGFSLLSWAIWPGGGGSQGDRCPSGRGPFWLEYPRWRGRRGGGTAQKEQKVRRRVGVGSKVLPVTLAFVRLEFARFKGTL